MWQRKSSIPSLSECARCDASVDRSRQCEAGPISHSMMASVLKSELQSGADSDAHLSVNWRSSYLGDESGLKPDFPMTFAQENEALGSVHWGTYVPPYSDLEMSQNISSVEQEQVPGEESEGFDMSVDDILHLLNEEPSKLCAERLGSASEFHHNDTTESHPWQNMAGNPMEFFPLNNFSEENSVPMSSTPESREYPRTGQYLSELDRDRPVQRDGSVLASEAKYSGSMDGFSSGRTTMNSYASGPAVQESSDVVDLTEDSDDDNTGYVVPRDRPQGSLKRKADVLQGRKTIKMSLYEGTSGRSREDSYDIKAQIAKHREMLPSHMSDSQWRSFSSVSDSKEQLGSNISTSPRVLSLDDHGSLSNQSRLSESERNSMQLSTYSGSNKDRPMVSSEVLSRGASTSLLHQRGDTGADQEEAILDRTLMSVGLLKHQEIALRWMMRRELEGLPSGGILADDQGLGKTVSIIALLLKLRSPIQKGPVEPAPLLRPGPMTVELEDDEDIVRLPGKVEAGAGRHGDRRLASVKAETDLGPRKAPQDFKALLSKGRPAAGTLVVCPTSVLRQWAHELKEKVTESAGLRVLMYHGGNRERDPDVIAKYDVVLTTYAIVSMEVPKQPLPDEKDGDKKPGDRDSSPPSAPKSKKPKKDEKKKAGNAKGAEGVADGEKGAAASGPLARLNWFRVVLDEAQSIKNSRTQTARAAWGLRAKRRWCLSGTPIQNAIDDLYSYFRFLRYAPYDSYKDFREKIKDPVTRNPAYGYKELQKCLSHVMIRRTKACLIDGQPIVNLPPRIVNLKQAVFSPKERFFYSALESESRQQFQDYAAAGTLQSNYVNILWMLLRLRQACDHPLLVKEIKGKDAKGTMTDSAKKLSADKRAQLLSVLETQREVCTVCSDCPDEATITTCSHVFCKQCILERLASGDDTSCPFPKCRKSLKESSIFTLPSLKNYEPGGGNLVYSGDGSSTSAESQDDMSKENVKWSSSSTKIEAVINTLNALPKILVVVENGKVVDKDFKGDRDVLKLQDTSNEIEKLEPFSQGSNDPNSQVSPESLGLEEWASVSGSATSGPDCESVAVAEKVDLVQAIVPVKPESGTASSSEVVQATKRVEVANNVLTIQETVKRGVVESREKAIVFSQWTSMLDLLEVKLKEANFNYRRLDGTMSVLARDRAVSEFKTLPEVTVIIMSLKAASLGLNMVAACHVLLIDIWWNPTAEDQAIDRAHRIGQTRPVTVSRFTVRDTIEDRILALQEKKRKMVASAFGEKGGESHKSGLSTKDFHYLFDVE